MHFNAASQATIVNNSRSGDQGISTNVALPKGGLLRYNVIYQLEIHQLEIHQLLMDFLLIDYIVYGLQLLMDF